jgi:ring-1,2-phenylacetyl-CoA epoxidase subunit PaaD
MPASAADLSIADRLMDVLSTIPDPEIPAVSLVDLGVIRQIESGSNGAARVIITPTYTGCPATLAIETSIRDALDEAGFGDVAIQSTLSPPWTTDWISDEGREKLRAYGIAPPERGEGRGGLKSQAPAACPRCQSHDTEEVSRFGSTPCKALWRCRACAEPFDRFKCI